MSAPNKNQAISGRRCVIDSCRISRRINPNIKLFEFPYNNEVLLCEWLNVCELDNSILSLKRLFICDKHFAIDDFCKAKTRLKRNVIPTKYLKDNDNAESSTIIKPIIIPSNTITQPNELYDKSKSGRHCVINSCKITRRSNPRIRLFTFPCDPERFSKWVKICQLKSTNLQLKRPIICEKHFLKSDLKGRRYTKNAEPRFFLSNIPKIIAKPKLIPEINIRRDCIIKDCNIDKNPAVKLLTFPKEATNLFHIWSDIFHINKGDIFNIKLAKLSDDNLYICEKHFITYAKKPDIFKEVNDISGNCNNYDENEIDLNNVKLEFVSASDPLDAEIIIKNENIADSNDEIESEINNSISNQTENLKKLLIEKDKFYQRKIKKMRNAAINDRKIFYKCIQKLKSEKN